MKKINWRLIVGILFSAVALWLILKDVSLQDLLAELAKANYLWLIPGALVQIVAMWLRAVRWRELLNDRIPTIRSFHISNVGNFLNNVLPLRLGELSKAYLASRSSAVTVMQGLSAVIIERLLDVLTVFLFLIIVLPFVPGDTPFARYGLTTAIIAVAGVIGLFVAAALRERTMPLARVFTGRLPARIQDGLLHRADDFLRGVSSAGGKRLAAAAFWSISVWLGWCLTSLILLWGFAPSAPWHAGIFVTCALALGLSIPSAPSGAGLYEAAAVVALAAYGLPTETALAYALVSHVFGFLVNAVFGVVGLDREGESLGHVAAVAQTVTASLDQ